MKNKNNKSLCKSCSNRVVIKFHGKDIRNGISKGKCFYDFSVWVSDNRYKFPANGATPFEASVSQSSIIVDECSFYNKSMCQLKKGKQSTDDDDDSDYGTDSKGGRMYGATFTNIQGALLP